jgi:biotin transport system substrate-specific component
MRDTSLYVNEMESTQVEPRSHAVSLFLVLAGSFLLALSAQIAVPVPFSTVPLTMQPLALLLLGSALGWRRAAAATVLYLGEGALGLPVFAHGFAGLAVLAGTTAGYLLAFPAAAAAAGLSTLPAIRNSFVARAGVMVAAIALIYLGGWTWLTAGYQLSATTAFTSGVAPFILADLCKALLAAIVAPQAEKIVQRFTA